VAGNRADEELVESTLAGDGDAFAALYDRYADRVHSFAYSRLRDPADAADALQSTFITAHRRLGQLTDPSRFRPWIFAIARTTIIDVGRVRARRSVESSTDSDTMPDLPSDDRSPERDLEAAQSAALLWEAAAGLQPRDQELLELHLREGLEGAELAEAMDVEPSHVYVMVKRLKERLGAAVGSLLVARRGRADCDVLDHLLADWDGRFSLDVRGRVNRHVEGCETCGRTRKAAIAWEQIAAAIPAVPAPVASRAAVLAATVGIVGIAGTGTTAIATAEPGGGALATLTSVVATIGVTAGLLAWPVTFGSDPAPLEVAGVIETAEATTTTVFSATASSTTTPSTTRPVAAPEDSRGPSTTTPDATTTTTPTTTTPTTTTTPVLLGPAPTITEPPTTSEPPSTTVAPTTTAPPSTTTTTTTTAPIGSILGSSFTEVAFGATLSTVTVELTNTGDQPLTWSATLPAAGSFFVLGPSSGTIEPGGVPGQVTVGFDRDAALDEGDHPVDPSWLLVTDDSGDSLALPLSASVERPPEVGFVLRQNPIIEYDGWCSGNSPDLLATAVFATVYDESGIVSVDIAWADYVDAMTPNPDDPSGESYGTVIGYLPEGTYDVAVSATDSRGNTATQSGQLVVEACEDLAIVLPPNFGAGI